MNWGWWRRVRRAVQWIALAIYVYLLFAALQRRWVFPLADLFFRLDPLVAGSAMLAGRVWIPRLIPALLILALTLGFGRVWCGWLCPLGTILDLVRFHRAAKMNYGQEYQLAGVQAKFASHDASWRRVKYLLFFLIVAGALLGNLTLLVLDPITILTRTMTTAVLPTLNRLVTGAEAAAYALRPLRGTVNVLEQTIRGPILPVKQGAFVMSVLFGALFLGILLLNLITDRFWCRYLCPLGGLLGLLSRISLVRRTVGPMCNNCAVCAGVCTVGAIHPEQGYESDPTECTVCLDCLAMCPQSGIEFQVHRTPAAAQAYDPSRRQFLLALGSAAIGVALLDSEVSRALPNPALIRPPGAQDEKRFLSRCVRCSQCMKVCPTLGLQPCLEEAGISGVWTPRLVPRLGYCDYSCNACGQVCPSGAIPPLSLSAKRETMIGAAHVNRDRCLPWAYGVPCIVCEEMCPTPTKAIRLTEATVQNEAGEQIVVQQPYVIRDLCIGCGICEYQCPIEGEAAIRVERG